ncbi:hypothetical protein DVH05_017777 [Phytophthora capsici]|nr:hypothetical protein DVH05_008376 [Phytophthora capsici]KAG1696868.1 hypothetical protein DVH05_017777 [Phytophthora capsici]
MAPTSLYGMVASATPWMAKVFSASLTKKATTAIPTRQATTRTALPKTATSRPPSPSPSEDLLSDTGTAPLISSPEEDEAPADDNAQPKGHGSSGEAQIVRSEIYGCDAISHT